MNRNKSGKIISVVCVVLAIMLIPLLSIDAYQGDEHNAQLLAVLFGYKEWEPDESNERAKDAIKALEYASYLSIDQYKKSGQDKLDFLCKDYKVFGIPSDISVIDFSANQYHRRYTHRGWDFADYPPPKEETVDGRKDVANWPVRKDILCATTNKVFGFGPFFYKWIGYSEKCNSFSALIYYVHIIGDNESDKSYENRTVMDLAYSNEKGIIDELIKHSEVLFDDQKNTRIYRSMISKLKTLNLDVKTLVNQPGGLNSDERFAEYKEFVDELLNDILIPYIPKLLRNEKFFSDVFYIKPSEGAK